MLLSTCANVHACIYNSTRSGIFLLFKQQVNLELNTMLKRDILYMLFTWPDLRPGCDEPNMAFPIHKLSIFNGLSAGFVLKSMSLK